ncbi:O-antigen ligase family protein [Asticcacaulis sp. EMRT-3]|uniref:O-antigen ligase family protein n=1 Tax=Asticcacaulis sp. EMRT-3 TaxID=3040349 RepID=UPI0024AF712C|nr:O-antigen ligase family protein [Asticcacaulis sp. EMRT-3]MDI7774334.1 O-antigen ligase family protein [Asticcacaulis sp. EMRT-3]
MSGYEGGGEVAVADGLWPRFREAYTPWVLKIGFAFLLLFAFFAPDHIAALIFLIGVFLLGYLRHLRAMIVPAVLTALILLMAFARSDFVDFLRQGMSLGAAYTRSVRYFQAPMVEWFVGWAVILAAFRLKGRQAADVMTWLYWAFAGLTVLQLLDGVSLMSLRNSINNAFFGGHRPEMVVVLVSNSNTILTMLFWPLAYYLVARRRFLLLWAAALTVLGVAVVVDTNAQVLAMAAGFIVFMAARHWPAGLDKSGVRPERVLAVLSAVAALGFPPLVLWLMRSGLALKIKTDLLPSWAARIDIWSFAVTKALEKPVWGWGFESSRNFSPMIPDHPHNMSLQAWLELGVPGLILLSVFWFSVFWSLKGTGRVVAREKGLTALTEEAAAPEPVSDTRPYWLATATAFYLVNTVSFGLWRDWFYCLGAFAVTAAFLAERAVRHVRDET